MEAADLQGFIIQLIILLSSTILIRIIFAKIWSNSRLPPGPMALPIIGHLHYLAPIPHQALHKLSKHYGPLIHIYLGSVPCVVISSPEMAKEFLKTHEACFSNRPHLSAADYLAYGSTDFVFAPYGPYLKFLKKLCMTRLLGGKTLEQLLPVRSEETTRFVKSMLNKAEANERVDVGGELLTLTNNVISRMAMGKRSGGNETEADEIRRMVKSVAELKGRLNLADFIWFCKNLDLQGFGKRLREVRDKFGTMIDRIIKEHQEARKTKSCDGDDAVRDILDILLEISEDETAEIRLTRENIKSFFLDIFAAGTDTSALTTEWALAELINHPDVMKKARQEIDYIVGKKRLVQESDIANLPYLQAIVKETLRLHPTGSMIVRESSESCTIRGFEIPAKTRLFVNVWAINRDPNYWEKPFEFEPERFLGEDGKKLDVRGQHFHLLPFGYGRRGCPGISLALPVVQTTIAAMIQCFEWKVVHRNGEVNFSGTAVVDMDEGLGLTLPRAHPLVCVPLARLNPFPSID